MNQFSSQPNCNDISAQSLVRIARKALRIEFIPDISDLATALRMPHDRLVVGGKPCCNLSSATNTVILSHTMAGPEIFILILGDSPAPKNMFGVRAPDGMSVNEWREKVHTKKKSFEMFYAADLTLWKVCSLCSLCWLMS